jgi:hypothetical protein
MLSRLGWNLGAQDQLKPKAATRASHSQSAFSRSGEVSDHGVESTGRDLCCVSQLRSGFSPLKRHDTASTSRGNVGRPRIRHV